jgi:hypothetical protein
LDHDYNAKFILDYVKLSEESWQFELTIAAIDPTRTVKVVPFIYLSANNTLPLATSLEREDGSFVKVV